MSRKKQILNKLGQVCAQMESILAGQNVILSDLPVPGAGEPGETDLEKLQRFKAILNETLAELNRGEPRACRGCDQPLPDADLDAMPWATHHATCR